MNQPQTKIRSEKIRNPEGKYEDALVVHQGDFRQPGHLSEQMELAGAEWAMHKAAHDYIAQQVGTDTISRKGVQIVTLWQALIHWTEGDMPNKFIVVSQATEQWRAMVAACVE